MECPFELQQGKKRVVVYRKDIVATNWSRNFSLHLQIEMHNLWRLHQVFRWNNTYLCNEWVFMNKTLFFLFSLLSGINNGWKVRAIACYLLLEVTSSSLRTLNISSSRLKGSGNLEQLATLFTQGSGNIKFLEIQAWRTYNTY